MTLQNYAKMTENLKGEFFLKMASSRHLAASMWMLMECYRSA
jgi:hypothetical protein